MDYRSTFEHQGYQIERELGSNRAGGRVTYLARNLTTQQPVVIKQFQFARSDATWTDYDAYDREILVLQGLDHPGIPCYLDSFHTPDGFCMVQEYKQAEPLSRAGSFAPEQIRKLAESILEILIYLQNRVPPIIHRDIKPDNILIDEQLNVYLVDFGFARLGNGEVGVSSVVKGTLGFMPPEQLFNRKLTEASDLYGLGMTLICLLTGTQPDEIGNLVDISYRVSFKQFVPKLSLHWLNWLEKMVEPKLKDRYANAAAALAALPNAPLRSPELQFSQSRLEFAAREVGESMTQPIALRNLTADTQLEGKWEVAPHPSDPPHTPDRHPWISIHPKQFSDNEITCHITINTSKLMANKSYSRQLLLHTNGLPKTYPVELHVKTAPIPIGSRPLPYWLLVMLGAFATVLSWLVTWMVIAAGTAIEAFSGTGFGALSGAALGFEAAVWVLASARAEVGAIVPAVAGVLVGAIAFVMAWMGTTEGSSLTALVVAVPGLVGGILAGIASGYVAEKLEAEAASKAWSVSAALLSIGLGTGVGLGFIFGFTQAAVMLTLVASGVPLTALLTYLPVRRARQIADYRRAERHLFKP